jgi:class 3 adenylate cyclase
VGDAVNVAFRLESQTEATTREIILGQSTYDQLLRHHAIFTAQTFFLKGKNDTVQGYTTTFDKLATVVTL